LRAIDNRPSNQAQNETKSQEFQLTNFAIHIRMKLGDTNEKENTNLHYYNHANGMYNGNGYEK